MESTKTVPQNHHESLLNAFHKSFRHHKAYPTAHGLRLFIANIELALDTVEYVRHDLSVLKALAQELLHTVEAEDHAVAAYNQRQEGAAQN